MEAVAKQLGDDVAQRVSSHRALALSCLRVLYYMDHAVRVSATVLRLLPTVSKQTSSDVKDEDISAGLARFSSALEQASSRKMSAGTYFETAIVVEQSAHQRGAADFDRLIRNAQIEIVPFNEEQALLAREAYRRYGKGNHRAGLNFGDCFAYALAKHLGEPLLFKGGDFARTDIEPAS